MLKFGGSRPESDGNDQAKDRDRKQRHQRTAAALAAGGGASNVPANVAMDSTRGAGDSTPKAGGMPGSGGNQQMAPPDIPYGTGQPPVVCYLSFNFLQKKDKKQHFITPPSVDISSRKPRDIYIIYK